MIDISNYTNEQIVDYLEATNKESAINAHYALNLWGYLVNRGEAIKLITQSVEENKTFRCRFVEGERRDLSKHHKELGCTSDSVAMWIE